MAALETRLLLLGAVSIFEPVNGYQLRRELATWHVDEWANIKPGSIYNGLATLTKRGELIRHDLRDGTRDVAVYELSEAGRDEFARLYEQAMTTIASTAPIALHTALALLPMVSRETALRHIRARIALLDERRHTYGVRARRAAADRDIASGPPHVAALAEFWVGLGDVEYEFLTRLAFRIVDGEFDFAGEQPSWVPAADDPGWQIAAERQRYLTLLGRA